jgi:imidazolonepropionase
MLAACVPFDRWVDVLCDSGAFDVDEARVILTSGVAAGLSRVCTPANSDPVRGFEWRWSPASVDHCTYASDEDIEALASGSTVATLLPGAEFSTRAQWPDAQDRSDNAQCQLPGRRRPPATSCQPVR